MARSGGEMAQLRQQEIRDHGKVVGYLRGPDMATLNPKVRRGKDMVDPHKGLPDIPGVAIGEAIAPPPYLKCLP